MRVPRRNDSASDWSGMKSSPHCGVWKPGMARPSWTGIQISGCIRRAARPGSAGGLAVARLRGDARVVLPRLPAARLVGLRRLVLLLPVGVALLVHVLSLSAAGLLIGHAGLHSGCLVRRAGVR